MRAKVLLVVGLVVVGAGVLFVLLRGAPRSSVPGWRSYDFGQVRISVPPDWVVVRDAGACVPSSRSAGELVLGFTRPATRGVCPRQPKNWVALFQPASIAAPQGTVVRVHDVDVVVNVAPPRFFDWSLLNVEAQVTGSGPMASRVLHTIRQSSA